MKLNANVFKLDGKQSVTEMIVIDEAIISPVEIRNQNTMPEFDFEEEQEPVFEDPVEEISFSSLVEQSPTNGIHGEDGVNGNKPETITPTKKRSSIRMRFSFKRKKGNAQGSPKIEEKQTTPKKKSKKNANGKHDDGGDEELKPVVQNETTINLKLQEVSIAFHWVKDKQVIFI